MIIGIRGSLCFTLKTGCFRNLFREVKLLECSYPNFNTLVNGEVLRQSVCVSGGGSTNGVVAGRIEENEMRSRSGCRTKI